MKFNIEVEGALKVEKFLEKNFPREVKSSMVTALNRTNTQIRSKATKRISAASDIKPQKLVRQRITRFKANRKNMAAGTRFKHASMNAELLGKPKWNRNMVGAKVQSHSFPGSFVGTPRTGKNAGKQRIYMRVGNTGNRKNDLRVVRIPLEPYKKYHIGAGRQISRRSLRKNFINTLQYRLGRKGF